MDIALSRDEREFAERMRAFFRAELFIRNTGTGVGAS